MPTFEIIDNTGLAINVSHDDLASFELMDGMDRGYKVGGEFTLQAMLNAAMVSVTQGTMPEKVFKRLWKHAQYLHEGFPEFPGQDLPWREN